MDDIDQILSDIDKAEDSDYELRSDVEDESIIDDVTMPSNDLAGDYRSLEKEDSETAITGPAEYMETGGSPLTTPDPAVHDAIQPAVEETDLPSFNLKGTKSWNTREPYTITLNQDRLFQEINYLRSSFYFIKDRLNNEELKKQIHQNFLKYIRRPAENKISDYEHFIYTMIISENENASSFFGFTDEMKHLFTYHCGPLTLYRMINSHFQYYKIAFCYRHESSNKSVRFYPEEFIREKVMNWYEENINSMTLSFDSIQPLNEIRNAVVKKYTLETKRFNQKLEAVNAKLTPERRISREKLIALKGDELFGMSVIEVYKRFLDRTIFDRGL